MKTSERPGRGRKLVSVREATKAKRQHQKPCSDCPWARDALNGWLGSMTIEEWLRAAHSNTQVECHTLLGAQCAGLAIYRRNAAKYVEPPLLRLEADRELVFSGPAEFSEHHKKSPEESMPKKKPTKSAPKTSAPENLKAKLEALPLAGQEQAFEEAANTLSEFLCTIRCSTEDYREGLRAVIERLQIDIRASEETDRGRTD